MASPSRIRRALFVGAPVLLLSGVFAGACGSERAGVAGYSDTQPTAAYCATPHEGCECYEPGKLATCGQVKRVSSDGYVACSMGHRQCLDGAWGPCIGEGELRLHTFMAGGGVGLQGLGGGGPCGSDGGVAGDPCDPYCHGFADDPIGLTFDGGLVVTPEGGLTIPPTAVGDASAPGVFVSTAAGVSTCGPARNIVASSCTPGSASALKDCQQDFHCDPTTSKCLWNGGPGYKDPTAGGIDLTVGAPCGDSGSAPATVPVCNRGTAPVPAGSMIELYQTNGPNPPNGCTSLGAPTFSSPLAADLNPGECTSFVVGNSPGAKFMTVNAGPSGSQTVAEAAGRCANNSAFWKNDGSPGCGACGACDTQVTGKVYAPSGVDDVGNELPLAGVTVFQPAGALTPFVDGVSCDTCESVSSPALTAAQTDATGTFTLHNVSPGSSVPIVVQSGRWRRTVTVDVSNACGVNTFTPGTFRMPRNRAEGDIPKMAVLTGQEESLACLLNKIGVSVSEIGGSAGAGDPKRIEIFRYNGMKTSSPSAPGPSTLMTASNLSRFSAVIMDCPSYNNATTQSRRQALRSFADSGGRLFLGHWAGVYILESSEFVQTAANWSDGSQDSPAQGWIETTTPQQTLLRDWLQAVNAWPWGTSWLRVDVPRDDARTPLAAGTTLWVGGRKNNDWGGSPPTKDPDYALSYSFETPFGGGDCGVAGGTGRVIYNGMHVSPLRGSTGYFPTNCKQTLNLQPEEKALVFQLFQLTACALGGGPPPAPPPPPPPLPVVEYQRDYRAVCGTGERVKWGPFYWQADIPTGTSIEFRAATADTAAALPPAPPTPGAPTTAYVGKTSEGLVTDPSWDCEGCRLTPSAPVTVDSELIADTGTSSKEYLRIYMTFKPTATVPPTLLAWKQIYDCVPAE